MSLLVVLQASDTFKLFVANPAAEFFLASVSAFMDEQFSPRCEPLLANVTLVGYPRAFWQMCTQTFPCDADGAFVALDFVVF